MATLMFFRSPTVAAAFNSGMSTMAKDSATHVMDVSSMCSAAAITLAVAVSANKAIRPARKPAGGKMQPAFAATTEGRRDFSWSTSI
jgi:hypothetical protein